MTNVTVLEPEFQHCTSRAEGHRLWVMEQPCKEFNYR